MRRAAGDSFLLLTPANCESYLGEEFGRKSWQFAKFNTNLTPDVAAIVAKSDYIRMEYVYRHGGFWVDADTILFDDPLPHFRPSPEDSRLHWHCEALFGAIAGNQILGSSARRAMADKSQDWGNPGGLKHLIEQSPGAVKEIDYCFLDPGYTPAYGYETCEVLLNQDVAAEGFLLNPEIKLLKLYNTHLTSATISKMTVSELLSTNTLLSRIFLKTNPSIQYWLSEAQAVASALG
jgi:hypothetical protein